MKLAPLLAQYLYTNKRLDLPGIGTFRLDPYAVAEPDNSKQGKAINPGSVSFENVSIREAPDLITFISSQTRKLKALAAADLDSHIELVQQFLNIGKPFLLEGIGSLVKIKSGEYAFTSGQVMPESMKDYSAREISSTSSTEESFSDYRKPINQQGEKSKWRKPVIGLLALAGIALAVWGGYTVYKMTTSQNNEKVAKKEETVLVPEVQTIITDTTRKLAETTQSTPEIKKITPAGKLKFVLEKANAKRAFERYAKLKTFYWPVQLETADSVSYTLFMVLPSSYADTARIVDSLTNLNGKRVMLGK